MLTLTAYQLKQALEFAAPGGDLELMDTEVTISILENSPQGYTHCVWLTECPEEGSIPLIADPDSTEPTILGNNTDD